MAFGEHCAKLTMTLYTALAINHYVCNIAHR